MPESIFAANLDTVYTRIANIPDHHFFLLGPRGTGKTTWLRSKLPQATWFNLLLDKDFLPLLSDPASFRERVLAQPDGWIVIDEVQRIPGLLNEVHDLISLYGKRFKFAMSGSSARKLRRMDANLLAGRALDRRFFPLTFPEFKDHLPLEDVLTYGALPGIVSELTLRAELLESYVSTYLREEIQQEALVKSLDSFARFLTVAGLLNGSVLDITNVARECRVSRKTVERYFDTLVDTLVAFRLPAFQPRLKVKERSRPKYYFFDCGVVRALTSRVRTPLTETERGNLFETFLINELRANQEYRNTGGQLSCYGTERSEVDVILSLGGEHFGIECKASERWRPEYSKTLRELLDEKKIKRAFGVYLGTEKLLVGGVSVLPVKEFLEQLWAGELTQMGA